MDFIRFSRDTYICLLLLITSNKNFKADNTWNTNIACGPEWDYFFCITATDSIRYLYC